MHEERGGVRGGGERPLLGFMFFHDLLSAIGDDGFRS